MPVVTRSTRPSDAAEFGLPARGFGWDLLLGLLAGVLAAWAAVAAGGLTTRWLVYFVAAAVLGAAAGVAAGGSPCGPGTQPMIVHAASSTSYCERYG